jgi:hypothetical protein
MAAVVSFARTYTPVPDDENFYEPKVGVLGCLEQGKGLDYSERETENSITQSIAECGR